MKDRTSIYTVSQINTYIKNLFIQDFLLARVSVKGEVSNCKYHSSGHVYFSLKDSSGVLSAIMFRSSKAKGLSFPMKDGDKVVVDGAIRIFEAQGKYQLYADTIELEGLGNLYLEFAQLKRELEEMGMFAPEYKRPIPKYAKTIGVVTASTGAAIRDIQTVAKRRNPYVQLLLYPALVQGEGASESIIKGIRALDSYGVDIIIIGRGGGSMEDLWAFNNRKLAEEIFQCNTPIISAVGHEVDFTIADFVSDLRAATPSAAAEIAVYDVSGVFKAMEQFQHQLIGGLRLRISNTKAVKNRYNEKLFHRMEMTLRQYRADLREHFLNLERVNPKRNLQDQILKITVLQDQMNVLIAGKLSDYIHRHQHLKDRMENLSPYYKIGNGYGYICGTDNQPVLHIDSLSKGDILTIVLQDGTVQSQVIDTVKRSIAQGETDE